MSPTPSAGLAQSYLRFFAVLLITNSHIAPLYPPSLQLLSTGGALGNSLFFFCSGYALYLSNREQGFYPWIVKRYTRIYPSVWLFMLLCSCLGVMHYQVRDIFIPDYWFLQAILVFYLLLFFTLKYFSNHLYCVSFAFMLPFLITYFCMEHDAWIIEKPLDNCFLHWHFYFIIMLLGAITARKKPAICKPWKIIGATALTIIIYYGLKIQILHTHTPIYLLQLLIPIFLGVFTICMFQFCSILSRMGQSFWTKIVSFIANLTLDIYIVQFVIMEHCTQISFPTGFLLAIGGIVIAAYLLNWSSKYITVYLRKIFFTL